MPVRVADNLGHFFPDDAPVLRKFAASLFVQSKWEESVEPERYSEYVVSNNKVKKETNLRPSLPGNLKE